MLPSKANRLPGRVWSLAVCFCLLLAATSLAVETDSTEPDVCVAQCANVSQACTNSSACQRALLNFIDGLLTGSCRGRERECIDSFAPRLSSENTTVEQANLSDYHGAAPCYLQCLAGSLGSQIVRRGVALLSSTASAPAPATAAGTAAIDLAKVNHTVNVLFFSATLVGLRGNVTGVFLQGPAVAGNQSDLGSLLWDFTWAVVQTGVQTVNITTTIVNPTGTTAAPNTTTTPIWLNETNSTTEDVNATLSTDTTPVPVTTTTPYVFANAAPIDGNDTTTNATNTTTNETTTAAPTTTDTTTETAPSTPSPTQTELANLTWVIVSATIHNITDEQVAWLLAGQVFVNVTTTAMPDGELAGQIQFDAVGNAVLTAVGENPPTNSTGAGTAAFRFIGERTLFYDITVAGLTGPIIASHFHGPAGFDESNIIIHPFVFTESPTGLRASGVWINLTDEQFDDVSNGRIYVNAHTRAFPGGEIRGQVAGLTRCEFGSAILDAAQLQLLNSQRGPLTRLLVPGRGGTLALKLVEASRSVWFSLALGHVADNSTLVTLNNVTDEANNNTISDGNISIGFFRPVLVFPNQTIVEPRVNVTDNTTIIIDPNITNSSNTSPITTFELVHRQLFTTNTGLWDNVHPDIFELLRSGAIFVVAEVGPVVNGDIIAGAVRIGHGIGSAILAGANEVPPSGSRGFGALVVCPVGDGILFDFSVGDLSGPVIAAHLHGLATPRHNAPIAVNLLRSASLKDGAYWRGLFRPVSSEFLEAMAEGAVYANVHTDLRPGGEIRGQVGFTGDLTSRALPECLHTDCAFEANNCLSDAECSHRFLGGIAMRQCGWCNNSISECVLPWAPINDTSLGLFRDVLVCFANCTGDTIPVFPTLPPTTETTEAITETTEATTENVTTTATAENVTTTATTENVTTTATAENVTTTAAATTTFFNETNTTAAPPTTTPEANVSTTPANETTTTFEANATAPSTVEANFSTTVTPNDTITDTTPSTTETTNATTTTIDITPTPAAAPPTGFSFVSMLITFFNTTNSNVDLPALRQSIAQFLNVDIARVFVQFVNSRRRADQSTVKVTVQTPANESQAMATTLNTAPQSASFLPAMQAAVPGATSLTTTSASVQNAGNVGTGNSESGSSGRYLSDGAIAGIAVGTAVGLVLLVALGLMIARRQRYQRGTVDPEQPGSYRYHAGSEA